MTGLLEGDIVADQTPVERVRLPIRLKSRLNERCLPIRIDGVSAVPKQIPLPAEHGCRLDRDRNWRIRRHVRVPGLPSSKEQGKSSINGHYLDLPDSAFGARFAPFIVICLTALAHLGT